MFNIECGEYLHFKGKPYIIYGTGVDTNNIEYVIYRHDYGAREFWIRQTNMFKETIERDGAVMKRFACVREINAKESLDELIRVWHATSMPLYHSEALEAYEIVSIDSENYNIKLDKSTRYEKKES